MNFAKRAEEIKDYIVSSRRYLHQHAELSFQEWETTAFLADELKKLGIPVQTFEDYPGCIATIEGGKPGKTVLLRADIDALPITEASGVDFPSLNEGVMHACGHDCHASMLLGAAKLLSEEKENLQGTVKLLFQSGEECFTGSHYYVDNGHLEGIDAAMGMHVWPTAKSGQIAVNDGYLMAACDNFKLTVHGKSAHGSRPSEGNDAIVAASSIITNLQSIVGRINDPLYPLVVTVGMVHGGTQFNIITDTVVMEGTVRYYDKQVRDMIFDAMHRVIDNAAAIYDCTADLQYDFLEPAVYNDDIVLNNIARDAAKKMYGDSSVVTVPKATGSEDFSYIMEYIPSSLFVFLGYYDEESGSVNPVHTENFRVNEEILPIGASEYAQFAADYLEKNAGGAE